MRHIRGKAALITGASRGIGPHLARALGKEGMSLVLSARSLAALEQTAEQARSAGARVSCIAADLHRRSDIETLATQAEAESGGIAVLVNNAGMESALPYEQVDPGLIEEMVAVNLSAPMMLSRLLLPHMIRRGEGHIVNISSLAGLVGTPYAEPYAATKHGLVGFSRSLRLSLRDQGHPVGISVICPGFVEDAGMYYSASAASGAVAPAMIGTVPMRKVSRSVVRAILRDEPEVVLSGKPMRPFLITQAVSPRLAARMASVVGVSGMFRRWAETSLASAGRTAD